MEKQLEKKELVFGAIMGKVAAGMAIAWAVLLFVSSMFLTIFQMSEGPSPLQELINNWPSTLFFLIVATPLAICGGMYGFKNASVNPRTSGWAMFLIGIASLLDVQQVAGIILIIAGAYTILFQKSSVNLINKK